MQNKTGGSKVMSKLYLFLPFLLLDREFHHVLGHLSSPLVQGLLGTLGALKKMPFKEGTYFPSMAYRAGCG